MGTKDKSLQKHLNDALIEISDSNDVHSLELLRESGINTTSLLTSSLEKIKEYSAALSGRIKDDTRRIKVTELKNKISEYLMLHPEKANRIVQTFIHGKIPAKQFQSYSKLENSMFEAIEDESILEDLIEKLNAELKS
ncbi:MAG TPA: hypothetical protein VK541_08445 [Pedobacter sp.]|uniref:hypothetical protein n=1 Tax=Pedobacter sp. TaxID=1411316 RepID=UPI002C6A67A9|nr:hypothetical protein [Pedobacter sp.]HMI02495.1 hypothetical protein [Pedobacter sp.]